MEEENNAISVRTILTILSQFSSVDSMGATPETCEAPSLGSTGKESKSTSSALIRSIQTQIGLLAELVEDTADTQKAEVCAACTRHLEHSDELSLQIDALRRGWMEEKSAHVQTGLNLQQMQHVVDACNVTFQRLCQSKDGFMGNGLPLSQIAIDTISAYCDEQRKQHWDETRAAMERKSSKMKKRARDMAKANQVFHDFALRFNAELSRYSEWLEVRRQSLQDNYQRYCQIMQERGAKPKLMYDDQEVLSEAEALYTEAWTARIGAARKGTEAAQLYGLSDPFEGMDEV